MYGTKLKAIRQLRDYTQKYVAEKAGIKQNVYCQIEKDEVIKVPDATLAKIAETLGVTVEDIKNPMPVVVSLKENIVPVQQQQWAVDSSLTTKVTEELARQLKVKDEQISALLELVRRPDEPYQQDLFFQIAK